MQLNQMNSIRGMFLCLLGTLVFVYVGCSSDPTSPNNPGGNDTINTADAPPIPKPQVPNDDPGAVSSIMTTISPAPMPDFAPWVSRALVNWQVAGQQGMLFNDSIWCDSVAFLDGEFWSDYAPLTLNLLYNTLPECIYSTPSGGQITLDPRDVIVSINNPNYDLNLFPGRFLLRQDNTAVPGSLWVYASLAGNEFFCGSLGSGNCFSRFYLSRGYRPIQAKPYLRRDRFWRRQTLEGSGASWLLLSGPVSGDIETSYTKGVARTETESFARSLSITVGAEYGIFSAEVQGTIEQSFESTIEISEESTVSFTKSVASETGQTVQFMVWELVDIYTFTDSLGNPLTDPNYEFDLPPYQVNGLAIALDATVWDL